MHLMATILQPFIRRAFQPTGVQLVRRLNYFMTEFALRGYVQQSLITEAAFFLLFLAHLPLLQICTAQ